MKNCEASKPTEARLIPFKAFRAMISRGEITQCVVRSGHHIWILGIKSNGEIVALRRTYGGPRTWVCLESPMKLLVGMGASSILIELDHSPLRFLNHDGALWCPDIPSLTEQ